MSVLERPQREPRDPVQTAINKLQRSLPSQFQMLLSTWEQGMKTLWTGDTAAILEGLGTNAVEIFTISAKTAAFLEDLKPGCTANALALRQPVTAHPDGTVTLD